MRPYVHRNPAALLALLLLSLGCGNERARAEQGNLDKRQAPSPAAVAKVGLTAGWATFGLALPQGAATAGLQIAELSTQTDVQTRWPDGSIRFAILTAKVSKPGSYAIKAAAASAGKASGDALQATVSFRLNGVAYKAELPRKATGDSWLAGPLVREWRAIVAPVGPQGKPHPVLRVYFDVRTYNDGKHRLDVNIENTLDVADTRVLTYGVEVAASGKSLFRQENVEHHPLTRWRKVFPLGAAQAEVKPDIEPFYRAKALPRYLTLVSKEVASPRGADFEILKKGALHAFMPAHGGRPELAPYPDWTACYLVHRNADQGRFVLAHGDLAGSWPMHVREPDGGFISLEKRPGFWLDGRERKYRPDGPRLPIPEGGYRAPYAPDVAHQPSLAYVPYLLTGDRYYADEMRFWANYCLLGTYPGQNNKQRGGSQGLLHGNEVRGIAWSLRNITDAAAYLPDKDPAKKYFAQRVINNLKWFEEHAKRHQSPLGTLWEEVRGENQLRPEKVWIATWEQNYLAWAIDHANQQGFPGALNHRDRIARFQYSLFTSPGFDKVYAGTGVLPVGRRKDGKVHLYKTFKELYDDTFASRPKPTPFPGYYGVDARLMLIIACQNGWPGARPAYDYLHKQLSESSMGLAELSRRAGWAIALEP